MEGKEYKAKLKTKWKEKSTAKHILKGKVNLFSLLKLYTWENISRA